MTTEKATMKDHPSTQQLKEFLTNDLSDQDDESVSKHLNQCDPCLPQQ